MNQMTQTKFPLFTPEEKTPPSVKQEARVNQDTTSTEEILKDHPELKTKTEPRSIRQQYLFPKSLLNELNTASERFNASKNSIVVAALEKFLADEQPEEATARNIIELYLKDARSPEEIAQKTGKSVDDVCSVLKEYQAGKHGKMQFSPAFHDYVYDYYIKHKNFTLPSIERHLFLRKSVLKHIVSGRNYCGTKYTKQEVMATWEDNKPEPKEDVQDVEALRNELDTVRREVNVLRQKQDIMADAFDSLATRVAQAAVALVHGRKDTSHD